MHSQCFIEHWLCTIRAYVVQLMMLSLEPGDLCVVWPSSAHKKNTIGNKKICLVISNPVGDLIKILKPDFGLIIIPKEWVKKIDEDGSVIP